MNIILAKTKFGTSIVTRLGSGAHVRVHRDDACVRARAVRLLHLPALYSVRAPLLHGRGAVLRA